MKYGKTIDQRWAEEQERMLRELMPQRVFAWRPVMLHDGRKAWLEWVWREGYACIHNGTGVYTLERGPFPPEYFATEDTERLREARAEALADLKGYEESSDFKRLTRVTRYEYLLRKWGLVNE